MKKKTVLMLTSLTCALCMTFAFAACNDEDDDVITPDTDVNEIASQQLSEEQWKSALAEANFANYKLHRKSTGTYGDDTHESTEDYEIEADKLHLSATDGTITMEGYAAVLDGKNYLYNLEDDGKWYRSESEYNMVEEMKEGYLEFADMYSDFTYSETEKGYLYSESEEEEEYSYSYSIVLKFLDGKLCAVITNSEGDDYSNQYEDTIFGYGKASVTLPTEYEEAESGGIITPPAPGPVEDEVAGKSYLFAEVLDAGTSPETEVAADFEGSRIIFAEGGEFELTMRPTLSTTMISSGTYEQDEAELTLTVVEVTINGTSMPDVAGQIMTGTVITDGIELTVPYDEDDTVTLRLEEVEGFGIDQYTDFDAIVSEQVTAEEWEAIFAEENFANYQVASFSVGKDNISAFISQYDDTKIYTYGESIFFPEGFYADEMYFGDDDGVFYRYYTSDGKWYRTEADSDEIFGEQNAMLRDFASAYAYFEYDEDEQGYATTDPEGGSLVIKVVDGKFCGMKTEWDGEVNIMIFYGYGEAEVTLPAYEDGTPDIGGGEGEGGNEGGGEDEGGWGIDLRELYGHYELAMYVEVGDEVATEYHVGEEMHGQLVSAEDITLDIQERVVEIHYTGHGPNGNTTHETMTYLWEGGLEPFTFVFTPKSGEGEPITVRWESGTFIIQLEEGLYARLTNGRGDQGGGDYPVDGKYPTDVSELLGTYQLESITLYEQDGEPQSFQVGETMGDHTLTADDYVLTLSFVNDDDGNLEVEATFTYHDSEEEGPQVYAVEYHHESGTLILTSKEDAENWMALDLQLRGDECVLHINYNVEGSGVDICLARAGE